jgi:hypothetical protein
LTVALDHLALNTQLFAGAHWTEPAALVQTSPDEATSGLEFGLNQKPHRHRSGMPAAGSQFTEN